MAGTPPRWMLSSGYIRGQGLCGGEAVAQARHLR